MTIHKQTETALLAAIVAAGGKQADLARKLDCVQQTISKLLSGEMEMNANWALRIEQATGVDAEKLYPPLARRLRRREKAA